jgi:hypothetical protein
VLSAHRARASDLDLVLAVIAAAFAVVVIAVPLTVAEYPPMVDLPFHAAQMSALAHYLDPAYHFREQFELHPFAVPYLSMYAVGALAMTVLPTVAAVKVAAGVMLALLPAGLAVLFHGMKKSPLLGLAGLVAVWGPLTHWGFLNFLGALGLFAMAVGLSMLVVDRPTPGRRLALGGVLLVIFFTHVFRYPLAIVAVAGAAVVMARGSRRALAVAPPVLAAFALFGAWMLARPAALAVSPPLELHLERLGELTDWLQGDFNDAAEPGAFWSGMKLLAAVALGCGVARARELRFVEGSSPRLTRWRRGALLVALGGAAASLLMFLVLPMAAGTWWYIYPREANAACFLALALLPDLPRAGALRVLAVLGLMAAPLPITALVARNYAVFDAATEDFTAISSALPPAPKLLYLIFDHSGSTRSISPFTHLPAYIQADRGGALSHHFARFGASPLVYRDREGREDVVPPSTPPKWEVHPELFEVREHGAFFDWFLVRGGPRPDVLFQADPSIQLERRVGLWWLYRRHRAGEGAR